MNVFKFRNELVEDYSSYVRSFMRIRDERSRTFVEDSLDGGDLWPEPLLQLNPSFASGSAVMTCFGLYLERP